MLNSRVFCLCLALLLLAHTGYGQTITGTILGTVTDETRAAIPGATVTIINVDTNRPVVVQTNSRGDYEVPLLKPGVYSIAVSAPGFQTLERQGIQLTVGARQGIDISLRVGQITEKVTVEARAGLVETAPGTTSSFVNDKLLQELPTTFGNLNDYAALVPGVNTNDALGQNYTGLGRGRAAEISVNGGRLKTNEMMIDGISVLMPRNGDFGAMPMPTSVQEMRVVTNTPGAEFGRTGGGVFNVVTKGGGNTFHGSLWELHANHALNANSFFANLRNQETAAFRHNYWGGSANGPIRRDKTFFHFDYQGAIRNDSAQRDVFTIPSEAEVRGDFSQTLNRLGQPVIVYDPETTRKIGNKYVRDPFPGNRIPDFRMNKVSRNVIKYYPKPNLPGEGPAKVNNFLSDAPFFTGYLNYTGRIDHDFSSGHRIFSRFTHSLEDKHGRERFGDRSNPADPTMRDDKYPSYNVVVNDTYTFSPILLLNTRAGFSRAGDTGNPVHENISLTELGFAPMLDQVKGDSYLPRFTPSGYAQLGDPGRRKLANNIWQLAGDLTWIRGRQTLKFGADARMYDQNVWAGSSEAGNFSFGPNFSQGPDPQRASETGGNSVASMLLGLGSGNINSTPHLKVRNFYYAAFVSDDIKLGRLLLNLGLRWEIETPRTERDNRFSTFNFLEPMPLPIPGLPNLRGFLTHAGQNGEPRGNNDPAYRNFSPRVGFAYKLNSRTILRAGYGISYLPVFGGNNPGSFPITGVTGSLTTPWIVSVDQLTPLRYLDDPFPEGALVRSNDPVDVLQIGRAITIADRSSRNNSYVQQWNFAVQREIGDVVFEAAYAGNKGTRMPLTQDINQQPVGTLALGQELIRSVPNPFYGIVKDGNLARTTIGVSQLLRPFPQYQRIDVVNKNMGSSNYHSLQIRAQRTFSRGFSLQGAYTWGKLIDDFGGDFTTVTSNVRVQDNHNLRGERSESEGSVAHKVVLAGAYDLPFGRGRAYLSGLRGVPELLFGGWSASGILNAQSGFPMHLQSIGNPNIGIGKLRPNSVGRDCGSCEF